MLLMASVCPNLISRDTILSFKNNETAHINKTVRNKVSLYSAINKYIKFEISLVTSN